MKVRQMNYFNALKVCALLWNYQDHANFFYRRVLHLTERYCIGLPRISKEAIQTEIKNALMYHSKNHPKYSGNPCNLLPSLLDKNPLKVINIDAIVVHCLIHGYKPCHEPDWVLDKYKEFLVSIDTEIDKPKITYFDLDKKIQVMAFDILEYRRWQEMPMLAQRLKDIGITDKKIISHLEQTKGHHYGCWAISALCKSLYDRLFSGI